MLTRDPKKGRSFIGAPIAKSGVSPTSLGTTRQNQTRDSGGNIFNPDQKPKSNLVNANVPVTGSGAGGMQEGYPGMNVAAVNTPVNAPGGGKVTKKVAGIAKFYGR